MNFYTEQSFMSYNGDHVSGIQGIQNKLESLNSQMNSIVYTLDDYFIQPGPLDKSILINVSGSLCMDNENKFNFNQVFQLAPNANGGYYLHNDMLKLDV